LILDNLGDEPRLKEAFLKIKTLKKRIILNIFGLFQNVKFKMKRGVTIQPLMGDSENRRNEGAFSPEGL
jgi:hypothetical protein